MKKRIKIPGCRFNKYALLLYQKKLIEENFCFLKCRINNNVLVCTGSFQPNGCNLYSVRMEYVAGHEPKTTILAPEIEPSKEIHMYRDHSICLFYSPDMPWNEKTQVYKYTIPWISEWIVYYELYLLNGHVWEGRESPLHIKESDKNINKNIE